MLKGSVLVDDTKAVMMMMMTTMSKAITERYDRQLFRL